MNPKRVTPKNQAHKEVETKKAPITHGPSHVLSGLHDGHRVQQSITILKPLHEVFEFCQDPENFPRFMKQLADIHVLSSSSSLWTWNSISGAPMHFEADIIAQIEDRMISWQTHETSKVQHAGSLWFQPVQNDQATEIQFQLLYRWAGGNMMQDFEELFGDDPTSMIQEDLRRLKQLLEAGEIATTEGQTHGLRGLLH